MQAAKQASRYPSRHACLKQAGRDAHQLTTHDLQDQSSGVQDPAEQETGISALLTDSL